MAVTATPLTLELNQELSIKPSLTECNCYNDSKLTDLHYRTIPNDGNAQWFIKWANKPSVAIGTKGDYAVAVTMFEYVILHGDFNYYKEAQDNETIIEATERGRMYIAKDPFRIDNEHRLIFRKIVWVRNSDLVLQSVADTQADKDAAEKKQKDDLDKLLAGGNNPVTGNQASPKTSSTIWIILGVLLLLIGGVWALISGAKKKRALAETEKKTGSGSNVNIIRIPKNS